MLCLLVVLNRNHLFYSTKTKRNILFPISGTTLAQLQLPTGGASLSSTCSTYNLTDDGSLVLAVNLRKPCFDQTTSVCYFHIFVVHPPPDRNHILLVCLAIKWLQIYNFSWSLPLNQTMTLLETNRLSVCMIVYRSENA